MKNKKLIIIPAFILALAVVLFLVFKTGRKGESGTLALSGNVEATVYDIGFNTPGRIKALFTDEGMTVKAGDRLAALDNIDAESEVRRNEAALLAARARLTELKAGSRRQVVKEAEAEAAFEKADLDKANKDFKRAGVLFSNGAIAESGYDGFKRALEAARARYDAALEKLSLAREGPRKEVVAAAAYRVKELKAALAVVRQRLRDTVIYSPVNGVVLKKNNEKGETVSTGMPVFTIGDIENPWIKVYVRETSIGMVKLGQKAVITVDSYPGKSYEGRVTYISSEAEFTPKNVQTREERVKLVFGVKVSVKNVNGELKPGMPADVKILLK